MSKKVIVVAWLLGSAGIAWACSSRRDDATSMGLWLHAPAVLRAA